MTQEIITTIIQLVILVGAYVVGKYVMPKLTAADMTKLALITTWAKKLVNTASVILGDDATGEQKLQYVSEQLEKIAKDKNIDITAEQIRALIEDAYAEMKKAEKEVTEVKPTAE